MNKGRALFALKIAVSITLLALLYRRIDFGELASRIQSVRPAPLALFFAILLFNTAISAAKWRILLRADDTDVPYAPLFVSYYIGTFFNVFLPSNIGGDVYRIVDISRRSTKPVNTFASVFADRLSGFVALSAFGFLFPLAGLAGLAEKRMLLIPLVVFGGLSVVVWLVLYQKPVRAILAARPFRGMGRLQRVADAFLASISAYRARPGVVFLVMTVSFVFQFGVIVAVYLLARAVRVDVPFPSFCMFVPLISLLEAVPVTIYGIGLRDSGYMFFMLQVGHTPAEAAAISVLYVAATLVYSSVGGILFALRRTSGPIAGSV